MRKIVLPGGSGFLGMSCAAYFKALGYEITILTRGASRNAHGYTFLHWDGETLGSWASSFEGAEAVINFTGKSVNCIYTKANKQEIIDSRVKSVAVTHQAILQCTNPPKVLIQAASLAIYGDTTALCNETAPAGQGFSVEVCQLWEKAFFETPLPDTRQALLRIGFVLASNLEGALGPLATLTKRYLGGTIGRGNQYISWLHVDDLNAMYKHIIDNPHAAGIYNATSPVAVTNRVFMKTLREAFNMPWSPPVPTPFVYLGAYLVMRTSPSLALTGRNGIPERLLNEGFCFKHHNLSHTLEEIAAANA